MGRVVEILKLLVTQFAVMETLTPQDFLEFRDKFNAGASGLQSHQMRVIESLLGLSSETRRRVWARSAAEGETFRDPVADILRQTDGAAPGTASAFIGSELRNALGETNFVSALKRWLLRTPVDRTRRDAYRPKDAEAGARALR